MDDLCGGQVGLLTGRTRADDAPSLLDEFAEHERSSRNAGQVATAATEWTRFSDNSSRGAGRAKYRDDRLREREHAVASSVYSARARSAVARAVLI